MNSSADFVAWHYEKSGTFSVRNAYRLALHSHYGVGDTGGSSNSEQGRAGWKKLWQVKVPSKVSVFAMKIVNNGLPTRVNKIIRSTAISSSRILVSCVGSRLKTLTMPWWSVPTLWLSVRL